MMALAALALLLGAGSGGANAAEQQVRLGVEFTGCPSCVYIVKQTLARADGVKSVDVSYDDAGLVCAVVFENSQTDVAALIDAIGNSGYDARALE